MQVLSVMEQERRFTIGELSERLAISQRTLIKDIQ
ncbi:HTH domain-containing protein, partial [Enterococcus mundtii]